MNMKDENFNSLRKLLALKRHEQPPPGYFDALPGRISARLAAEPAPPFWKTLFPGIQWQTALGYSFSLAIFASLFFAAHSSLKTDRETGSGLGGTEITRSMPLPLDERSLAGNVSLNPTNGSVTNLTPEVPSLFDGRNLRIERVNFPENR